MSAESVIEFGSGNVSLSPSPINPEWILEGNPIARNTVLSSSADGVASTLIWDCTAGRFNWSYDIDETVYVIEGSVIIKDGAGVARRLSAGDTVFFPAGSSAEWTVQTYVRKVAFMRDPGPRSLRIVRRVYGALKRRIFNGNRGNKSAAPSMLQDR
jgi:uncharacterized cupin superfamily protein